MENNNPPIPPDENNVNEEFNKQFGNPNPPQQNFQQQQQGFQQQNFQQPVNQFMQPLPPVPNATASLVLGIIGLVFSIIWCYFVAAGIGLILSIVALIIGGNAIKAYNENPSMYSETSFGNAKAGRVLGLIGMIIAILWFLFLIIAVVFIGALGSSLFRF